MAPVTSPQPAERNAADFATSIIRTWVPIGVGGVLAAIAARLHFALDPGTSATVGALAASACAAVYYALARLLESRRGHGRLDVVMRRAGTWMLGGVVRKPIYISQAEYDELMRKLRREPDSPST